MSAQNTVLQEILKRFNFVIAKFLECISYTCTHVHVARHWWELNLAIELQITNNIGEFYKFGSSVSDCHSIM